MKHPNAVAGSLSGAGFGALIVWGLGAAGVDVPVELGPVIAGAASGVVLFFGRNGVKGLARIFWSGSGD